MNRSIAFGLVGLLLVSLGCESTPDSTRFVASATLVASVPEHPKDPEADAVIVVDVNQGDELPKVFTEPEGTWHASPSYLKYSQLADTSAVLGVGGFLEIVSQYRDLVRESEAFAGTDLEEKARRSGTRLRDALDAQLTYLLEVLRADGREVLWCAIEKRDDVGSTLWSPIPSTYLESKGYEGEEYFRETERTTPIVLMATREDTDTGKEFDYAFSTESQAVEFRAVVNLVHKVLSSVVPIGQAAARLAQNDLAWENYLRRGFSQYPWENLVNDQLVSSSWDRAPARQWVVFHPEPAVLIDVRSSESADADAALLVHGLGHLWYIGEERNWFLGGSITGSVTTDDDNGLGFGATAHFGTTALARTVPHVSVSVLWQDAGEGGDGLFVGVSIDAFRLISSPSVDEVRN